MTLRAQLPAYSPLPFGALGAGLRAAIAGGRSAAEEVDRLIRAEYRPHELLLTDSGTSALALAISLSTAARPGPVALPGFCCYDIATAVDAAGTAFALYDVAPDTLGPDLDSLRRVLSSGAGTVVVAHLYGVPVDLAAVCALADEFGASVVEDAAQGVGARWRGRTLGSTGPYGVLSFARGKGVTGGGGGALLANTDTAAAVLRTRATELSARGPGLRVAVAAAAQALLARPSVYGVLSAMPLLRLGETVYRAPHPPAKPALFTLGALSRTLRGGETETSIRKAHAQRLLDAIGPRSDVRGYCAPLGAVAGYLRFPLLVAPSAGARFKAAAARRLGIWPSYPRSLADLSGFGERRMNAGEPCAGGRELAAVLVTLPTHGRLEERDLRGLERLIGGDLTTVA